jgi:hypothetical protein
METRYFVLAVLLSWPFGCGGEVEHLNGYEQALTGNLNNPATPLQLPRRVLVATTKSGRDLGSPSTANSGAVSAVPVAQLDGMSAEQSDAARLNALWLKARIDDIDNDGFPRQCDADPAIAGANHRTARCPAPVGRPYPHLTKGYPQGSLMCKDGYVVTGHKGRSDWLRGVTRMALMCTPRACTKGFGRDCARGYWTGTYGISSAGGNLYNEHCHRGVAIGLPGATLDNSGNVGSIGLIYQQGPSERLRRPAGVRGRFDTTNFRHQCAAGQVMQGVVVRMAGRDHLTGLQAVCTPWN